MNGRDPEREPFGREGEADQVHSIDFLTCYHEEVDIIIDRQDQLIMQQHMLDRGRRWVTSRNRQLEPWPPHMRIELPRHQAHARQHFERLERTNWSITCNQSLYRGPCAGEGASSMLYL